MQTKLTLRMDQKVIQRAKRYVKRNHRSLSKVVADYFFVLEDKGVVEEQWTPLVRALKGVLAGRKKCHEHYRRHLEDKYL